MTPNPPLQRDASPASRLRAPELARWPSFRSLEIEAMKFIRMWLSVLLCAPALVGSATATSIPMVEPRILVCLAYESKSAALTKSTETSLANAISLAKKSAADLSSIKAGLSLPPLDENSDSWTRPTSESVGLALARLQSLQTWLSQDLPELAPRHSNFYIVDFVTFIGPARRRCAAWFEAVFSMGKGSAFCAKQARTCTLFCDADGCRDL